MLCRLSIAFLDSSYIHAGQLGIPPSREIVLEYVVERKRMDDLDGSITDGRFLDQKVLSLPRFLCVYTTNHSQLPEVVCTFCCYALIHGALGHRSLWHSGCYNPGPLTFQTLITPASLASTITAAILECNLLVELSISNTQGL